mgnify:CR=1 FL=1
MFMSLPQGHPGVLRKTLAYLFYWWYDKNQSRKLDSLRGALMDKYRCTVCGYIYDPKTGDSTQEIKPDTAFSDLPDAWVCPECGVGKDMFEKV